MGKMLRIIPEAAAAGGGNATVPAGAPIQPPQAFVDHFGAFLISPSEIDLSDAGITALGCLNEGQGGLYDAVKLKVAALAGGDLLAINLSGNAISNTNAILAAMDQYREDYGGVARLDLSGGTTIPPTGPGLVTKAALSAGGWDVTTN